MAIFARRHEPTDSVASNARNNLSVVFNIDVDVNGVFTSIIFERLSEKLSNSYESVIEHVQDSRQNTAKDLVNLKASIDFIKDNLETINHLDVAGHYFSLSVNSYSDDYFKSIQLLIDRKSTFYLLLTGQSVVDHHTPKVDVDYSLLDSLFDKGIRVDDALDDPGIIPDPDDSDE